MNTGCWTSKQVITSHPAWNWQKMPKKIRYMLLGEWTTEDSEAYDAACQREKRVMPMAPGYARGGIVIAGSNKKKGAKAK